MGKAPITRGVRIIVTATERYFSGPALSCPVGLQLLKFLSGHPKSSPRKSLTQYFSFPSLAARLVEGSGLLPTFKLAGKPWTMPEDPGAGTKLHTSKQRSREVLVPKILKTSLPGLLLPTLL